MFTTESADQPQLFDMRPDATGVLAHRPPLAIRMRPRSLGEIRGHEHLIGSDSLLPRLVASDTFGSLLFYGPPGCGKTTFAETIAAQTRDSVIHRVNAITTNTAELRAVLYHARMHSNRRHLLLIDEIHRFNKAQQDLLLPDVEAGHVRIIGCTTHNPGFYIIPPLLSRSHLFRLEPLDEATIARALHDALHDVERGLGATRVTADEGVLRALARMSDGDLRRALNALETLVAAHPLCTPLVAADLATYARERHLCYDATEDEHYDAASALIKSIRGSDPDAALYWMTLMLHAGEDPRFIARRFIILASEDVGLADSRALALATATQSACETVGMPECALNLAHCALFLATCPKSNSVTLALAAAQDAVKNQPRQPVPLHLRDAHTKLNRSLGHGAGYRYSHDYPEGIAPQSYLARPLHLYTPGATGAEVAIAQRLAHWQELRAAFADESVS